MKIVNYLWSFVFGYILTTVFLYHIEVASSKKENVMYKYVGFADYGDDIVSQDDLKQMFLGEYRIAPNYDIKRGAVRDANVAAQIGICVLSEIYGKEYVSKQKPFKVFLVNDKVWMVKGKTDSGISNSSVVYIQKADGAILSISK